MDYIKFYNSWNSTKSFQIENDCIMPKTYIFTPFIKTNKYGYQDGDFRRIIICDILARYSHLNEKNVLFPTGYNTLSYSAYVENKKISNVINDDITDVFYEERRKLGIGINENMNIDMKSNDFLANLQQFFIDLYNRNYITYRPKEVYIDHKNKKIIANSDDIEKEKEKVNCFILNFKNILPQIISDIKSISCDNYVKEELLNFFKPKEALNIKLYLSNGNTLDVLLDLPELLGGVSFIFINPDHFDLKGYVDDDYIYAVRDFIAVNDELLVYTGLTAMNPLTGKKIPVFASRMFDIDIYLGIPSFDEDAEAICINNDIKINDIYEDGVLINSDLLDGCDLTDAHDLIVKSFVDAEIASIKTKYMVDEINLTSLDNLGPLFPFLEDKQTGKIHSLEGYLPYVLSSKLRPTLVEDVDIVGSTMSTTINNLFVEGVTPILCTIYDNIGSIDSLFVDSSKKVLKDWLPIEYLIVKKESLISSVLMPIILINILKKEVGYSIPSIIRKLDVTYNTLDVNFSDLTRCNNNLLVFDDIIEKYQADAIRFYMAIEDVDKEIVLDYSKIEKVVNTLNNFSLCFNNFANVKPDLDLKILNLHSKITSYLLKNEINNYAKCLYNFINNYLINQSITKKQASLLLKMLYPICPFLTEELNKEKIKAKYLLSNTNWNDFD